MAHLSCSHHQQWATQATQKIEQARMTTLQISSSRCELGQLQGGAAARAIAALMLT
jgi:hypothetical protein